MRGSGVRARRRLVEALAVVVVLALYVMVVTRGHPQDWIRW